MDPFRIAIIAIMAYVILGLAPLLDSGQFVLPIGLFKPTFFVILVIGLIVQKKKLQFSDAVALVWTFGLLLTSKFIFDIFWNRELTENQINIYYGIHDIGNLITYIFLLFWMLLIAWREKSRLSIDQVIGALGFFVCLMMNAFIWTIFPLIIWFLGMFFQKKRNALHYGLATFLFFVVVAVWCSAYFFGEDAILLQL